MDPVTALTIAGTASKLAQGAFQVGNILYEFVQDVKNLEATAEEFASEVNSLAGACDLVSLQVRRIVQEQASKKHGASESEILLPCLDRQLAGCRRTIDHLEAAVTSVGMERAKKSNVLKQVLRQIQLNMKATDIEVARNRIRSHTSSLHLTLQSIAIEVSYVIPNRVDEQLRPQLEEIGRLREELESLRALRTSGGDLDQQRVEADVLKASDEIISNGTSLYNESVAGGSIIGEMIPGKGAFIYEWIRDANALDRVVSPASTAETDTPSVFSRSRGARSTSYTEDTTSTGRPPKTDLIDRDDGDPQSADSDLESEDEFAIEAVHQAMSDGRSAFADDQYAEAAALLQEALKMARELPVGRQAICDLCEIRFMLGVCAFHLDPPSEAKEALLSVIDNASRSRAQDDEGRKQVLDAAHLLAQTFVRLGQLESARSTCDSALRGRGRLLGKTHYSCFESLALKARILELQGNSSRASIYAAMVPRDRQRSISNTFADLKPLPATTTELDINAKVTGSSSSRETSGAFRVASTGHHLSTAHGQLAPQTGVNTQRLGMTNSTGPKERSKEVQGERSGISVWNINDSVTRSGPRTVEIEEVQDAWNAHKDGAAPLNKQRRISETESTRISSVVSSDKVRGGPESSGIRTEPTGFEHERRYHIGEDQSGDADRQAVAELTLPGTTSPDPLSELANVPSGRLSKPTPSSGNVAATLRNDLREGQHGNTMALRGWFNQYLTDAAGVKPYVTPPIATRTKRLLWRNTFTAPEYWSLSNSHKLPTDSMCRALLEDSKKMESASKWRPKTMSGLTLRSTALDCSPLHLACLFGDIDVVKRLLSAGAKASLRCRQDFTTLHCAAAGGYRDIAELLIAAGCPVDTNADSYTYGTPLCFAVLGERLDVVDLLLSKGAKHRSSLKTIEPLAHIACMTGNIGLMRAVCTDGQLLSAVANVAVPDYMEWRQIMKHSKSWSKFNNKVAIGYSHNSAKRSFGAIDVLVSATPLAVAAYMGCNDAVIYLASIGMDLNRSCTAKLLYSGPKSQQTILSPLHLACMAGWTSVVKTLLQKGADTAMSCGSSIGYKTCAPPIDALWLAAANFHDEVVLTLLTHGVRMHENVKDVLKEGRRADLMHQLVAGGYMSPDTAIQSTPDVPLITRKWNDQGLAEAARGLT